MDSEPRSGAASRRHDEGHQAWDDNLPVFRDTESGPATGLRQRQSRCGAREGLGTHRTIRWRLASTDCPNQADRLRCGCIACYRHHRWQADRRTPRCHRQLCAVVPLYEHRRHTRVELYWNTPGQTQWRRKHRRVAGAISRQRPGRSYRQNNRLNAIQERTGEPEAALWSGKVIIAPKLDAAITPTTDGEIAIINLQSARQRSWTRFFADPAQDGVAETVVEHEQLTLQFVGDVSALDRIELLAARLDQSGPASASAALVRAQVASTAHRFSDARHYLVQAETGGAPTADVDRLRLNIDQACGSSLDSVLDARRRVAAETNGLEDFVALGSLLADLRDFDAADRAYKQGLRAYRDVSPFPVARVCFQLGMLWGELASQPNLPLAAHWYRHAIAVLPMYTRACVHLAEICSSVGNFSEAEALLRRVVAVADPVVACRLAAELGAQCRSEESDVHMKAARSGFEALLVRHLLAFAGHGAEFYAGSGSDYGRALHLARFNADNRPTLRAL